VPLYVITNGRELAVYRLQSNLKDELELSVSMQELPQQWARLESSMVEVSALIDPRLLIEVEAVAVIE
jgi:hypothetical protein